MKKPSPKMMRLILKASLKEKEYLKNLSNGEIVFLYRLGIGELITYGFSLEDAVKLLVLIKQEITSRA